MFGSVAGIFSAFYYRREGPVKPKAQWEIDEENEILNPIHEEVTEGEAEIENLTQDIDEKTEDVNEESRKVPVKITYTYIDKSSGPSENKVS